MKGEEGKGGLCALDCKGVEELRGGVEGEGPLLMDAWLEAPVLLCVALGPLHGSRDLSLFTGGDCCLLYGMSCLFSFPFPFPYHFPLGLVV